ncbi:MAG: hypothetical protein KF715_19260 [Candidatus Didemnitutus sp.]|nr:hypothetical protein [Candidatus Didemnitutus sp.]
MRRAALVATIVCLAFVGCDKRPPETIRAYIERSPIIVLADPVPAQGGVPNFVAREIWLHTAGSPFTPELGRPVPLPRSWAEHWGARGPVVITYSVEGPLAWPNSMRPVGTDGTIQIGSEHFTPEQFKREVLNSLAQRSRAVR